MSTAFRIPIAYPQPTAGLSFHQSLDSLVSLNTTINDIFHKLNTRVLSERSRLDSIGSRIAAAEQKVQNFQRNNNSILVASPAHFPVESLKPVEPLFPEPSRLVSHGRHPVNNEPAPFVIERVDDLLADQLSCKIDDTPTIKKNRPVLDVSNLVLFGAPKKSRKLRAKKQTVVEQDPAFDDILPETDPSIGKYIPDIVGLPDARSSLPAHLGSCLKNIAANVSYAAPKPQVLSPLAVYEGLDLPTVNQSAPVAQPASKPLLVEDQPPLPVESRSDKGKEEQSRHSVPNTPRPTVARPTVAQPNVVKPVAEPPKVVQLLPPPSVPRNDAPMKRGTPPPLPGTGPAPKPVAQRPNLPKPVVAPKPATADEPMRRGTPPALPKDGDAPMRRGIPPPLPGTRPNPKPAAAAPKPAPKPVVAPKPAAEAPKPAAEPPRVEAEANPNIPPPFVNLQDILRNALVNIRVDLIPQKLAEEDPNSDWDESSEEN